MVLEDAEDPHRIVFRRPRVDGVQERRQERFADFRYIIFRQVDKFLEECGD